MRHSALRFLVVVGLLFAACGDAAPPRSPTSTRTPITTTSEPPLDGRTFDINQEFWHSGFQVRLTRAEVTTSSARFSNRVAYWLTMYGSFENLGTTDASFDPAMAIHFDGAVWPNRHGRAPQAAAGATSEGYITMVIGEDFTPTRASFVIGAEGENQAIVPFNAEEPAVRLEPESFDVSGSASFDFAEITLHSATLRFDDPMAHEAAPADTRTVTLELEVASHREKPLELQATAFTLRTPSGSDVSPISAHLPRLGAAGEDATIETILLTFPVAADGLGEYRLHITPAETLIEEGPVQAIITFSL